MALLHAAGLRVGYGRGPDVVAQADLDVEADRTVAILGPSGGGKTTLLKAIAGLVPPRAGTLEVAGARWPALPPRGAVGYIPQRLGLVRHGTVMDNVLHGGLHETPLGHSLLHRAPAGLAARGEAALAALGLEGKAEAQVHTLSGGQQRRVAIARALVQRPRLLLADEFLGELDPANMETVIAAVKGLQRETGMGLVLVEHHLEQAMRLADQVYRLKAGRLRRMEEA